MGAQFKLEGSGQGAVNLIRKLNNLLDDTEKGFKKGSKGAGEMERAAKRIVQQTEGPQERYNRKLKETADLFKKGKLTAEQNARAVDFYNRKLKEAGRSGSEAFGSQMLSRLSATAAGFVSIGTAVSTVKEVLAEVERQAQGSADAVFGALGSIGSLQQISDSPADFQKNLALTREAVRRGVFADYGAGADFTAAVRNAGFSEEEVQTLLRIGERKQIKSEGLVDFGKSATKVANLYGGDLTLQQVADRIGVTSKVTQAKASETALATTKFAQQSGLLGFAGNESLAALSAIEREAGNIDLAATQQGALYDQILRRRLAKGTLGETLDAIQARIDAGETEAQVLGESNAIKAHAALMSQRELYRSQLAELRQAEGFFAARDYLATDPDTFSASNRERAAGLLQDSSRANARVENLFQAVRDEQIAHFHRRGQRTRAAMVPLLTSLDDSLQTERGYIMGVYNQGVLSPETQLDAARYLRDTYQPGLMTTDQQNQTALGKYDRMIELLERQLGVQEETSRRANQTTSQQEP